MANGVAHKGGKKNRKWGRNLKTCEDYKRRGQREINKAKKLVKHLWGNPYDPVALRVLVALGKDTRKKARVGEFFDHFMLLQRLS